MHRIAALVFLAAATLSAQSTPALPAEALLDRAVLKALDEELAAAGLVSYNSNQVSAWWRDDQDLIRWGHLDARGRTNAFAIMIPVREARALQRRLARGERITLHAVVRARNDDTLGYETLVATIPGTDPAAGDIVFSCHLDHEKPGANDNASGCAANLEIARTLTTLIDTKRVPPPVRTIRFIWPSEMTGTIAYLSKYPEIASRIRAAVYEIVNFIDGTRSVSEIRDAVSAEFEPLELTAVAEYLDLLAKVGAVSFKR